MTALEWLLIASVVLVASPIFWAWAVLITEAITDTYNTKRRAMRRADRMR